MRALLLISICITRGNAQCKKEETRVIDKKSLLVTLTLIAVLFLSLPATAQHYQQTNLVSDLPGVAALQEPNLVNPWGIATGGATGPWWVNANGSGISELF